MQVVFGAMPFVPRLKIEQKPSTVLVFTFTFLARNVLGAAILIGRMFDAAMESELLADAFLVARDIKFAICS